MGAAQYSETELEEFAQRANCGEAAAGALFLAANLSYWIGAARALVHARHQSEVDDLVQEAIVKLLELWRDGRGPARNTRAYVVVSIRHAYIDLLRSPRSRVRSLEDSEETALHVAVEPRYPETIYACEAVARALTSMSDDHRLVLEAVVVHGLKPSELVERCGRSAPAISNLLFRAKRKVRDALTGDDLSYVLE